MLAFPTIHLAQTMPSNAADNSIMAIGEVADYLKVTERTSYLLAGAKQILAFTVCGGWRFSKADLEKKWIEQQSTQTENRTTNATDNES